MNVRLAFAGASGTGKTTLAQWASEKFGLPVNPVGSRSVAQAMGFDNPYDVDKAGRRAEFQRRLVAEKRAWEDARDAFVVDRTTLDNLVYTMMHDVYAIDRTLLNSVIQGLGRYTHIVFCPVDVFCNLGGDPNRVNDTVYHELYDEVMRAFLRKYVPHMVHVATLRKQGLAERKEWVGRLL
jgi:AAA domain